MRYIINKNTNPFYNLALDEYALNKLDIDEDIFFLWQNEPSVIIGKNQTTLEEINPKFIEEQGVKVARRVSGGGAVYHDFGNLNFTFIVNVDEIGKVDFKKFVQPVIDALASMGITAIASGRNDILVEGLKISGNAQRAANGRVMHHGTLLFDVNIEDMVEALNVDPDKIISKGVKSVRSRVTNIKEHLPEGTTLEMFWEKLHYFLSNEGQDEEIVLSESDINNIEAQAMNKFGTWQWVYGNSPAFNYRKDKRFTGGKLEVLVDVEEGHIKSIRFLGDFLGLKDVNSIENRLIGTRFQREDVDSVLSTFELENYFGKIEKKEILEILFD